MFEFLQLVGRYARPTTIFVQKFRYHGVPATLQSGVHQFYFQNKESFPITHEMIPVALPAGKTAPDVSRPREGERSRFGGRVAAHRR